MSAQHDGKQMRAIAEYAKSLGYTKARATRSNHVIYKHPSGAVVTISVGASPRNMKNVKTRLKRGVI